MLSGSARYAEIPWQPRADVYRISRGWLVKLELAGIVPGEVQVHVRGRTLLLQGNRRDCRVEHCIHSVSMEIAYSKFERAVQFPENVEGSEMNMEYRDGMLLVHILTGASE
jgi:HSP20 family protein